MSFEPIDVPAGDTQQPETAPEPQQSQQQPETQPTTQDAAPEPYKFRLRGLDRQIPAEDAQRMASYLGWKPEGFIERLRAATQVESGYAQLKREQAEFEAQRQQFTEAMQAQEQERAARLQGRPSENQDEDPISYLRVIPQILERQQAIERRMDDERRQFAAELHREREQQTMNEISGAYEQFVESKRARNVKAPIYDLDTLIETAEYLGIDTVKNPVNRILEAAYRYLAADELPQQAQEETLRRLRDPKAQVLVPGSPSTSAAPQPTGDYRSQLEAQVSGLKWGDVVPFIQEQRR